MYKKLLVLLSIIVSMNTFADDNEDIKYIYKLYQNKDYKISAEESEKFLFRYPGSKHYDVAQNLMKEQMNPFRGEWLQWKNHLVDCIRILF